MPNWCNNQLTITGPEADLAKFKAKAVGHSPWHTPEADEEPDQLNFHSLVPIPEEVLKAGYEAAGYDWELKHWGCRWGACESELVDEWESCLIYKFDTAWSPPVNLLKLLGLAFPDLTFILEYEEGGMGYKGLAKAHGELAEDHCISL